MSKRALLIGVNEYAIAGADLRGCVNDVHNVAGALTDLYGFADSDITMLVDGAATKAAMTRAMAGLVDSARPGDVLYLHYSGHGSNVPDTNGDETTDHRDEILCPHDLDWSDPLTDDWLRTTFDRLDPGASLTVVMDCCHSGSNTREPPRPDAPPSEVLSRFLPNPDDEAQGVGSPARRTGPAGGSASRTSTSSTSPRPCSAAAATTRRRPTPTSPAPTTAP